MSLKNFGVSLPSLCDPGFTLGQLSKQQEITENEVGASTNQLELNGTSVLFTDSNCISFIQLFTVANSNPETHGKAVWGNSILYRTEVPPTYNQLLLRHLFQSVVSSSVVLFPLCSVSVNGFLKFIVTKTSP